MVVRTQQRQNLVRVKRVVGSERREKHEKELHTDRKRTTDGVNGNKRGVGMTQGPTN